MSLHVRSICTVCTLGTSVRAKSRREPTRSVMTMGWHPAARAARRVTRPMGPAPLMCEREGGTRGEDKRAEGCGHMQVVIVLK
jgi:hypothetical protein